MKVMNRNIVAFCVAVVGAATQASGQLPTTITPGTMVRIHRPRAPREHFIARVLRVRGDSLDLTYTGYLPSGVPFPRGAPTTGGRSSVVWSDVDVVVGYDMDRREVVDEGLIGGPLGGAFVGFLVARTCLVTCTLRPETRTMVKAGAVIGLVAGAIHAATGTPPKRTLRWGPATGIQGVAIEPDLIKNRPSLTVSVPF